MELIDAFFVAIIIFVVIYVIKEIFIPIFQGIWFRIHGARRDYIISRIVNLDEDNEGFIWEVLGNDDLIRILNRLERKYNVEHG